MRSLSVFLRRNFKNFSNFLEQLNAELQTFGQQQTENGTGPSCAILPNGNNIFLADRYFPPFELVGFLEKLFF